MKFYRPMLKTALYATFKYRYLWFFGLFAALVGNSGVFNLAIQNMSKVESAPLWLSQVRDIFTNWEFNIFSVSWETVATTFDFWGSFVFVLFLVLSLFLLWLSISSQAALVYGAKQSLVGKEGIFNVVFKKGRDKFWSVLLLNIFLNVTLVALLVLVSLPFVIFFLANSSILSQNIIVILSFTVLVPLAVIFALIMKFALIYVVNENRQLGEAIVKAWYLFVKNWLIAIETGLLLLLINIVATVLLIIFVVFLAIPFVMLGIIASQIASTTLFWLVAVLGLVVFILILFLYGAIWNTFQMSVWVILFEKLQGGKVFSKIMRVAMWFSHRKEKIGQDYEDYKELESSKK